MGQQKKKRMPKFKKTFILYQNIALFSLIPSSIIILIIGSISAITRVHDVYRHFENACLVHTRHLTIPLSYALKIRDMTLLQKIMKASLEKSNLMGIAIYNKKGTLLVSSGIRFVETLDPRSKRLTGDYHMLEVEDSIMITMPLDNYKEKLHIFLNPQNTSFPPKKNDHLAWLAVQYSTAQPQIAQYQLIIASILLIVIVLILTPFFAIIYGKKITGPIQIIVQKISQMVSGEFEPLTNIKTYGEMSILKDNINELIMYLKKQKQDMQKNIKQATADLQETLDTIEIQNIELGLAKKEALEASRVKSKFLANISHEIRTPLNGIIGFTKLLLKSNITSRQQEYLRTIYNSSEGLLAIINDVLDFSKIEAGKLELEYAPMNLREVLDESIAILAPSAHEKNLELIVTVDKETPINIIGDALRLKQIITNLTNNAIKCTQEGSIIVRAKLEKVLDQRATIKIMITDTGVGLSKEQQKILFKAFSRAMSKKGSKIEGTGLGLAICKNLAQQMDGDIGVTSVLNQGSTFWFTFKVYKTFRKNSVYTVPKINKSILLVENNPQSRESLTLFFSDFGFKVTTESKPQDIEKHTRDALPDFIVLSHNQNSIIYKDIKDLIKKNNEECSIIILTSTLHEQKVNQIISHRKNTICLIKPITQKNFYDALNSLGKLDKKNIALKNKDKKNRILIVDDNEANLKLLKILLEEYNVQVKTAKSGKEAIKIFNTNFFDLIFMDIHMPNIDGIETTKKIREIKKNRQHVPIIAITAHAMPRERKDFFQSGIDDYMAKPINEMQLLFFLKKWINHDIVQKKHKKRQKSSIIYKKYFDKNIIDMKEGLKLAANKKELALELLRVLLDDLITIRRRIINEYHKNNWDTLLEIIHKLHGATKYCGVPRLRKACSEAEKKVKNVIFSPDSHSDISTKKIIEQLIREIDAVLMVDEKYKKEFK